MTNNYATNVLKISRKKVQCLTNSLKGLLFTMFFVGVISSAYAQCSVSVSVNDNGDGTSTLYASGNGQGSISYDWSDGSSGSQITVTNDGSQYCVYLSDYYWDPTAFSGYDAYGYPEYNGDYVNDNNCSSDCGAVAAAPTPPVAYFGADVTSGDAPLTVNFTDATTNNPTSFDWDFGDGNFSTAQNPSNVFTTPGTYTVTLTVTNADGTDTYSVTITVNAPPAPVASFSPDVTSGDAPLTVNFTDNSTNTPTSWAWDFGDGTTSTDQNPSNVFTTPGTYNVTLTVTNDNGTDTYSITITVNTPPAPVASFTPDVTSGDAPLTVNFTDNSTNTPTSWAWDFGDGTTSTDQNPSNVFTIPGTYNVTLTVTNATGTDTYSITITVNTPPAPDASFTPDVTSGDAPLTVNFTDNSTNTPTSWAWDFSDGTTSTDQNPTNVFTTPGTYTVSLIATNATGSSTAYTVTITVNEVAPIAQFGADKYDGEAALLVNFEDQSLYNPTSWAWDFGDGNTSTNQNPSNIYANAGSYDVTLTATNSVGTSTSSISTITVISATALPIAQFTEDATSGEAPLTVNFTDQSTENPTSWSWEVDGSVVSTDQNLIYTFDPAGTYNVTLTVDNGNGTNTSSATTITVNESSTAPVADFTADTYSGDSALTVQFTDASTNNPTSWFWDFGDGETSSDQNPEHIFTTVGTFTVTLTVDNGLGSADTSATIEVLSPTADSASIEADKIKGNAPLTVQFTDLSTNNPTAWDWDYGNGDVANTQNPSYTFTTPGTYTVTLTTTTANGNFTASVEIEVTDAAAGWITLTNNALGSDKVLVDEEAKKGGTSITPFKICADGSAVSIVEYEFPEMDSATVTPNNFTFRLQSDASGASPKEWGKFDNYQYGDNSIKATYTHPDYLNNATALQIDDSIEVYDASTGVMYAHPISIYRAPVMMIHGLWSEGNAFSVMESQLLFSTTYTGALLHRVDYKSTNDVHFGQNSPIVPNGVNALLTQAIDADYSAGKVDVVGHSMGGILTRLYLQSPQYANDLHKLITLNTPHAGSQCGNIVSSNRWYGSVLRGILWLAGNNPYKGAVEDLKVDGAPIQSNLNGASLNANKIPCHAITSTKSVLTYNTTLFNSIFNIFSIFSGIGPVLNGSGINAFHSQLYDGEDSDLIVSFSSQVGGLSARTDFPNQQIHMGSPEFPAIITKVESLLAADPTGADFDASGYSYIPVYANFRHNDQTGFNSTTPFVNQGGGTVKLKLPNITAVNPGDVIPIEVSSTGTFNHIIIGVGNDRDKDFGFFKDSISTHYIINYTVPQNVVGKIHIGAIAYDTTGFAMDSATLLASTNSYTLDSMEVYPKKLYIPLGSKVSAEVTGFFAGIGAVEISHMPGVAFTMGNSTLINYVNDNVIKGIKKGSTYLRVAYKGKTKLVPVEVIDSVHTNGVQALHNKVANASTPLELPVKVYPNPTTGLTYITYTTTEAYERVQLDVYDMYGKLVRNVCNTTQAKGEHTQLFDANNLANGLYYIRLQNGTKLGHSKLSIIK